MVAHATVDRSMARGWVGVGVVMAVGDSLARVAPRGPVGGDHVGRTPGWLHHGGVRRG